MFEAARTPDVHPAAAARGATRAAEVQGLFAGIARRYDLVNRIASGGRDVAWRRAAARATGLGPGSWCVDACCGTADLSIAVAELGAQVVGVDFCRPMLAIAPGKSQARGRVHLAEGDALRLPVRAASVDAACIGFGLRNVADVPAALAEMVRVVRPGGRVVVLEFSRPSSRILAALADLHVRHVLPRLGDALSGRSGTYRYLPETIAAWHSPEALAGLMEGAGLVDVTFRRLTFGVAALHAGSVAPSPRQGAASRA